jgi:hypothetical protein
LAAAPTAAPAKERDYSLLQAVVPCVTDKNKDGKKVLLVVNGDASRTPVANFSDAEIEAMIVSAPAPSKKTALITIVTGVALVAGGVALAVFGGTERPSTNDETSGSLAPVCTRYFEGTRTDDAHYPAVQGRFLGCTAYGLGTVSSNNLYDYTATNSTWREGIDPGLAQVIAESELPHPASSSSTGVSHHSSSTGLAYSKSSTGVAQPKKSSSSGSAQPSSSTGGSEESSSSTATAVVPQNRVLWKGVDRVAPGFVPYETTTTSTGSKPGFIASLFVASASFVGGVIALALGKDILDKVKAQTAEQAKLKTKAGNTAAASNV